MSDNHYLAGDTAKIVQLNTPYKGGQPPTGGDMEARVKRLEDDMKEIKGDLKSLLKDSAEIKGKISNMPSTWQIVGIVGVMLSIVIASGGGLLALIRYLQP